jgi:hypothetical protein
MSDELKPQSVDGPELRKLIAHVQGFDDGEPIFGESELALIAHIDAWRVPAGYKLVPIEPTKEMALAGADASERSHDETSDSHETYAIWDDTRVAYECYTAMLNAAPKPEDACGS